jgi:hypothetical protein
VPPRAGTALAEAALSEITVLALSHDRIVESAVSASVVIHRYCRTKPSLPAMDAGARAMAGSESTYVDEGAGRAP